MKIAIEAQRIFRKKKHGMDIVALETIKELQKIDKVNEYYIFVNQGDDVCLESKDNFHVIQLSALSYFWWEQVALPLALKKLKPDLLHSTSNTAPIWCKIPLILTLHDIIFMERMPKGHESLYQIYGRMYRRFVLPRILPHCRKILTVSEYEMQNINQQLKLGSEVTVVYNGYSEHFRKMGDDGNVVEKYIKVPNGYIMFLGNTDPKKNTKRTLKAYGIYAKLSANPLPLLICDLSEKLIDRMIRKEGIDRNIKSLLHFPGYIDNVDLPYLYNGAKVFLYTSLRESFGIPILESMACGTPVITSNTSAIPEIAGTGAVMVSPQNEAAIAKELIRLETDPDYYQQQVQYGLERVKEFSWKKTARKVLEIYNHK
jgi:glycosyltransferase involved in cell wall biosynthesis